MCACRRSRPAAAAHRAARPREAGARERAAAQHALAVAVARSPSTPRRCPPCPADRKGCAAGCARTGDSPPLGDVMRRWVVPRTAGARARRGARDRRRPSPPTAARPPSSSCPRIAAAVGAARALLPLGLGRQPPARPRAERGRLEPVDERDRMVVGRGPVRRGSAPPSATKAAYSPFVTGVRPSSNAARSTMSCSPPSRPIGYSPAGTSTQSKPGRRIDRDDAEADVVVARAGMHRLPAEQRSSSGPWRYEPPRTASPLVHSQTLPAMSSAPNGDAPAGCEPTGTGPPMPAANIARERSGSSSPHGQSRSSPPRAAASHSSSLGSRTPVALAERLAPRRARRTSPAGRRPRRGTAGS